MTTVARLAPPPAAQPSATASAIADDYVEGAGGIAEFLGPLWTERKVYHAREIGALPIRRKQGIGLYAFKSELLAALKAPETLSDLTPQSR